MTIHNELKLSIRILGQFRLLPSEFQVMKIFCFVIVYVLGPFIVSNVECREYVDLRVVVSVLGGSRVLCMPSYLLPGINEAVGRAIGLLSTASVSESLKNLRRGNVAVPAALQKWHFNTSTIHLQQVRKQTLKSYPPRL